MAAGVYSGCIRAILYLFLLENGRIDDANDNQAGDDQSESDEGDEKHAASAGGKFPPYDPVLVPNISMGTISLHYFQPCLLTYLALKVPSSSNK